MFNELKMGVNAQITSTQIFPTATVSNEDKIRYVISEAGGGNTIVFRGRIIGQDDWDELKTSIGNEKGTLDVITYDELQMECTVYDSASNFVKVVVSSFNDAGGSTTIDVPAGGNITGSPIIFTSSDDSITIVGTGGNTIDFTTSVTGGVTSVNGETGDVILDTDDIDEGVVNLYFTPERAQTAVISQVITDGVTDKSPSEDAVFDALATKAETLQDAFDNSTQPQIVTNGGNALVIENGGGTSDVILGIKAADDTGLFVVKEDGTGIFGPINVVTDVFIGGTVDATNFNLQGIYNNSFSDPEIVLTTDLGAITFKQANGGNTDNVLEVQADTGDITFTVNGLGDISTGGQILAAGDISGANLSGTNTGDQDAVDVPYTPSGNLVATDVQAAIDELEATKVDLIDGDFNPTTAALLENQAVPVAVTGLIFATAVTRSFKVLLNVAILATSSLSETFELTGDNSPNGWQMSVESLGDNSLVSFSIDATGQILYTSSTYVGFASGLATFRATTIHL